MVKKRYRVAQARPADESHVIMLDEAQARTPLGNALVLPNARLADAVAAEWHAQGEKIVKETMPLTQIACVAIDLVALKRAEVLEDILPYGETDLVFYRAGDIPELAQQQAALLDPVMAWAEERFGVSFRITGGVMPVRQPEGNRGRFAAALSGYDDWKLAALAVSVKPLGSLILSLAFIEGRIDAAAAFTLSHLEEIFETNKWGGDEEKDAKMEKLKDELENAQRFLGLL